MTFTAENQLYKKITVQLSVRNKRERKSCFEGVNELEKVCVLGEIFNQILTLDKTFYQLMITARNENKTETILE